MMSALMLIYAFECLFNTITIHHAAPTLSVLDADTSAFMPLRVYAPPVAADAALLLRLYDAATYVAIHDIIRCLSTTDAIRARC